MIDYFPNLFSQDQAGEGDGGAEAAATRDRENQASKGMPH